ncbi:MAG: hypothetical protein K9N55_03195 [Phycisphaerae bacterium]|nr:hypothetical protein [Phycisphaerae bacterium]
MGRYIIIGLVLLTGIVYLPIWAQDANEVNESVNTFKAKYQLILDRNIFSKDRTVYVAPPADPVAPPPPPIEASYALVGISSEDDTTFAFIENTSGGQVDRYSVKSKVANGTIVALTLDVLQYAVQTDPNDPNAIQTTEVRLGQTLLGSTASLQGGARPSMASRSDRSSGRDSNRNDRNRGFGGPAPSSQTNEADQLSEEEQNEILRRMMERRQNE